MVPVTTDALADQYLLEAGLEFPIRQVKDLLVTIGPRWEGAPAYNLFPVSNDGFGPGYAVSAGPGLEHARNNNVLHIGTDKAVHRDRTGSYPDSVDHTHGDAVFAQYIWLASVTHRF